jgi:hypothetical protein
VTVVETTFLKWEQRDGSNTQLIIEVRNDTSSWVFIDGLFVDGDQEAHVTGTDGTSLTADGVGYPISLDGLPRRLGPGETGYYVGSQKLKVPPEQVGEVTITTHSAIADGPPKWTGTVKDSGWEAFDGGEEIRFTGEAVYPDDGGRAVGAVIARDKQGKVIGYAKTFQVIRDPGHFSMCCAPGGFDPKSVGEMTVIIVPDE